MRYFQGVVDFVELNFIWIIAAFFAVLFVQIAILFVSAIKRKSYYGRFVLNTDKLYVMIITNLIVIIGLYILACLVVGFVNCIKDQDWHFYANYVNFTKGGFFKVVSIIFAIAGFVIVFGKIIAGGIEGWFGFLLAILGGLLGALVAYLVLLVVGFILYVVISFVIIVLKLIWFVFSGFFISAAVICSSHWLELTLSITVPGVIYGCVSVFKNYILALKEEVFEIY